jgi:hypothetical protein
MAAFGFGIGQRNTQSGPPGVWRTALRLALLALPLLVVLGLFLQSLDVFCLGLGSYLGRGGRMNLSEFLQPPREVGPGDEGAEWNGLAREITEAEQRQVPVSAKLDLNASATEVSAEYTVTGPPDLINGMARSADYRGGNFVQQVLGAVEVNGETPRLREASHDVPGGDKPAVLRLQSAGIPSRGFVSVILAPLPRRAISSSQRSRSPSTRNRCESATL